MKISTRGRYALIIMISLAKSEEYLSLKDISIKENISMKYLEKIMALLKSSNLVTSCHGKNGGYRLTRKPEEYQIGDILRVTEGDMSPVPCLEDTCDKKDTCEMFSFYQGLYKSMNNYMDNKTLKDLL